MKGIFISIGILAVFLTASVVNAQTVSAENEPTVKTEVETKKVEADEPASKDDSGADKKDDRKRIVTRDYIKKFRSPVGDAFLKPFRAIAPAVTSRITQFEEKREFEYLFGIETGLPIKPQFGSSRPGSGFGVGFTVDSGEFFTKDLKITGSSLASFSGYVENSARIEYRPQLVLKDKLKIDTTITQSIRPKEDFYGSGANSDESNRSTFFHRQYGVRVEGSYQLNKRTKIGAFTEITRSDITDGKDSRGLPISTINKPSFLPGLARNIRLHDVGGFVELDHRDKAENPHAGWYSRFQFTNTSELSSHGFGWKNYKIDSRAYVPLGSKLRVLAVRFQGDFNDQSDTGEVPFYRLASLGDDETLRGYDLNRFRGRNAMHLNIEYRFKLMQGFTNEGFKGVEAIMFTDIGQVYDNLSELKWRNVRATWGGGFQFVTAKRVGLAVLYAKSKERGRLIFRFGKTF